MSEFRFALTDTEKTYLKDLVRSRIALSLAGRPDEPVPPPPTDNLARRYGAFVTLTRGGRLRGCIGHIAPDKPLYETIADMALAAAFEDPRFAPLGKSELDGLDIEISILSPITRCPDPEKIEIGRHGLIVRQGFRSGLLLPQVAVEWKWDRAAFLAHTCQKAGLPGDCWKRPDTEVSWFEAEVF